MSRDDNITLARCTANMSGAPDWDRTADPLPPGHPASWTAITRGTCLEDAPYQILVARGRS
jgi:hypothetical protein